MEVRRRYQGEQEKGPERQWIADEISRLESLMPQYLRLEELRKNERESQDECAKLAVRQRQRETKLAELKDKIREGKKAGEALAGAPEEYQKLLFESEKHQKYMERLQNLLKVILQYEKLQQDLLVKQREYRTVRDGVQKKESEYRVKNQAFLDEQAGILAQRILRKHSRKECDKNRGARRTSDEERQSRRAADDAEISPLAGRRQ